MIVIENFLDEDKFATFSNLLLPTMSNKRHENEDKVFYVMARIVDKDAFQYDPIYNMQLVHSFDNSDSYKFLEEAGFLEKLNISVMTRAKANITFQRPEILEHGLHCDMIRSRNDHPDPESLTAAEDDWKHIPFKTAVFYLNDCDGYTLFEDGTKIYSKANTLVEFDRKLMHTGTNTTNHSFRGVLNLNYLPGNWLPALGKNRDEIER